MSREPFTLWSLAGLLMLAVSESVLLGAAAAAAAAH